MITINTNTHRPKTTGHKVQTSFFLVMLLTCSASNSFAAISPSLTPCKNPYAKYVDTAVLIGVGLKPLVKSIYHSNIIQETTGHSSSIDSWLNQNHEITVMPLSINSENENQNNAQYSDTVNNTTELSNINNSPDSNNYPETEQLEVTDNTSTSINNNDNMFPLSTNHVPTELRLEILRLLEPGELSRAATISREWGNYANDSTSWHMRVQHDFSPEIINRAVTICNLKFPKRKLQEINGKKLYEICFILSFSPGTNNTNYRIRAAYTVAKRNNMLNNSIYNCYVNMINEIPNETSRRFEEIHTGFNYFLIHNSLEIATIIKYINAAREAGRFDKAQDAYNAAIARNLVNTVTFSDYIHATIQAKRFDETQNAYNEAVKRNLFSATTFANHIDAATQANRFQAAQNAYKEAIKRNLIIHATFAKYIEAARQANRFDEAQNAYNTAIKYHLVNDTKTFASYISAASHANRFDEARDAYNRAIKCHLVNAETFANYIKAARQANKPNIAQNAYREAKKRKLVKAKTFASYIKSTEANNRHNNSQTENIQNTTIDLNNTGTGNLQHDEAVTNTAESSDINNLLGQITLLETEQFSTTSASSMLQSEFTTIPTKPDTMFPLSYNHVPAEIRLEILRYLEPEDLSRTATISKEWGNYANDPTLWHPRVEHDFSHEIIKEAKKIYNLKFPNQKILEINGKTLYEICLILSFSACANYTIHEIRIIYNLAIKHNMLNTTIYNRYVNIISKIPAEASTRFEEIHTGFNYLLIHNSLIADIINNYINAARDTNRFNEAQKAYTAAIKRNLVNTDTFSNYIVAASQANRFDEAQNAYYQALELNLINANIFVNYIWSAEKSNRYDEAKNAFNRAFESSLTSIRLLGDAINANIESNRIDLLNRAEILLDFMQRNNLVDATDIEQIKNRISTKRQALNSQL